MSTLLNIVNQDVVDYIGAPAILEQCSEECAELGQASLKMARKLRDENPTPKTLTDIQDDLTEELSDVLLCIDYVMHCCNITVDDLSPIITNKQIRWIQRINENINEEGEEENGL